MKHDVQNLIEFFKLPFPYLFLVASLALCPMLWSYDGFGKLIYDVDEKITEYNEERGIVSETEKFEFGISTYGNSVESAISEILGIFGLFLLVPSLLPTIGFISSIEAFFPGLHPTTIYGIAFWTFIYFNTIYWLLLSYLSYSFHSHMTTDKLQTIFSKSNP